MQIAPDIQLPSLPEVTLQALEACQQDHSYRSISQLVSADTALSARILSLANSSLYSTPANRVRSIEQALMRLGTKRFHTLILTASLRQLLTELGADQWQQLRDFWRHSLTTALTARALATLTRYPAPEEAFMLGILHNIGELIALQCADQSRRQQLLDNQAELTASLVSRWGLGNMAADAMRYQQHPPREIRDASHLVKLINLSTRLALSDAAGISAAGTIFGLSEELTRELNRRIAGEVAGIAESLGVSLDETYQPDSPLQRLRQSLLQHAAVSRAITLEPLDVPRLEALSGACNSLAVLTAAPVLFFGFTGDSLDLLTSSQGECPDLQVTGEGGDSLLTRAFQQHQPIHLADSPPMVLDRQLLALLGTESMMAWPLVIDDTCPGIYIVGTTNDAPDSLRELCALFTGELSTRLARTAGGPDPLEQNLTLRSQIHEISNPLTIVRQYIHRLRQKLEDPQLRDDIDVIREELERASTLLLQLNDQDTNPATGDTLSADANAEIRSLASLMQDSLLANDMHTLTTRLSDESTRIALSPAGFRQILINLVRNAAEAMAERPDGEVQLVTRSPVWHSGRDWVELEISDNAGGLPEAVRQTLFQPAHSDKGPGHSGLGLSIVKQLVDEAGGNISCTTGKTGTQFRILLPVAANDNDKD